MEQRIISFVFILMVSSAAEDIKNNLTRVRGTSVTFPDPVLENGFLTFKDKTIATVQDRKCKTWGKIYEVRLFWDNKTGLFTLNGLQRDDSGMFRIESIDGEGVITYHNLRVYEPVSAPEVKRWNMSSESCTLLCEVQKAEETTLYWYRDTEIVNQSSLSLSLPLTLHRQDFTASYRCVQENPADNNTLPVNATALCSEQNDRNPTDGHIRSYTIVVPIVITAVVVTVAFLTRSFYLKKKATEETQGSEHRDSDVVYTDIHIPANRRTQERNQPDSPGAEEGSRLHTVYDKIQAHRIVPAETDPCLYSQTKNSSRA